MVEALGSFLHNIDALFLHEDVLSQGHTELMLQHLSKERVARLPTGLKTLGGQGKVTDRMMKTCLDRMAAWVLLATKRLEAEFPEHQTLQAFRVFDLSYQRFQNPSKQTATLCVCKNYRDWRRSLVWMQMSCGVSSIFASTMLRAFCNPGRPSPTWRHDHDPQEVRAEDGP